MVTARQLRGGTSWPPAWILKGAGLARSGPGGGDGRVARSRTAYLCIETRDLCIVSGAIATSAGENACIRRRRYVIEARIRCASRRMAMHGHARLLHRAVSTSSAASGPKRRRLLPPWASSNQDVAGSHALAASKKGVA